MSSPEFDRVMFELTTHPKEREGFKKSDLAALHGSERKQVLSELLDRLENGQSLYEKPLKWLLGEQYRDVLSNRLAALPPDAHGQMFLPFFLFEYTGERHYIDQMMHAIVSGDPEWEGRRSALGAKWYLRGVIRQEPLFWDFCRYLILHDASLAMRKEAMLWLAHEKGVPHVISLLKLTPELANCVELLHTTHGQDPRALAVLDKLHQDTGAFKP